MAKLTNITKELIRCESERIRRLKLDALEVEERQKYVYSSPDGKTTRDKRITAAEYAEGWRPTLLKYKKVTAHISPSHANWPQYRAARRRVSLLLTARLLLKLGSESIPSIADARIALKNGRLGHHASRKKQKQLAIAALRYLRKLSNRLERRPGLFASSVRQTNEPAHNSEGEEIHVQQL
jgi:hypothetical protein